MNIPVINIGGQDYLFSDNGARERVAYNQDTMSSCAFTAWEQGGLYNQEGTGTEYADNNRIRTDGYIPRDAAVIATVGSYEVSAYLYDTDGSFLGVWDAEENDAVYDTPVYAYFVDVKSIRKVMGEEVNIRLLARSIPVTGILPAEGISNVKINSYNKLFGENGMFRSAYYEWEQGGLYNQEGTGTPYVDANRIRTGFLPDGVDLILSKNGDYEFSVNAYAPDGNFIGTWVGDGLKYNVVSYHTEANILAMKKAVGANILVKVVARKNPVTAVTPSDGEENISIYYGQVSTAAKQTVRTVYTAWEQGGLYNQAGTGTPYADANRIRSKILKNDVIRLISTSPSYEMALSAYDKNMNYLGSVMSDYSLEYGASYYTRDINLNKAREEIGAGTLFRISVRSNPVNAIDPADGEKNISFYRKTKGAVKASNDLNVLIVGNSFAQDEFAYVPPILHDAFPDLPFHFGILYHGGGTLANQITHMQQDTPYTLYSEYNAEEVGWVNTESVKLSQVINKYRWDMVVFNQNSSVTDLSTNLSDLKTLIDGYTGIMKHNVMFGWQLAHVKDGLNGQSHQESYAIKAQLAQDVYDQSGVSYVMGAGTAVENARTTDLDELGEKGHLAWDTDGHLQEGLPCLLAAYSNFLQFCNIIGEKFHGSMGDQRRPGKGWIAQMAIPVTHGASDPVEVTDENSLIAAKCAIAALKNPFEITDCSEM